jgi:hypothetical protein
MSTYTLDRQLTDYTDAALEDRSAPRIALNIHAILRPSGITGFSVIVTNLSLSGFACEATTGIAVGSRCWLSLPGLGALQAEVAWNNGITVGCGFSNLLNQAVLDAVVQRHGILVSSSSR